MSSKFKVKVLGELTVSVDNVSLPLTRSERQLVATLVAAGPGVALGSDQLADNLWSDALPNSWPASLRNLISRVNRKAMDSSSGTRLIAEFQRKGQRQLAPSTDVDLWTLTEGRVDDWFDDISLLVGEPFPDCELSPILRSSEFRVQNLRRDAIQALLASDTASTSEVLALSTVVRERMFMDEEVFGSLVLKLVELDLPLRAQELLLQADLPLGHDVVEAVQRSLQRESESGSRSWDGGLHPRSTVGSESPLRFAYRGTGVMAAAALHASRARNPETVSYGPAVRSGEDGLEGFDVVVTGPPVLSGNAPDGPCAAHGVISPETLLIVLLNEVTPSARAWIEHAESGNCHKRFLVLCPIEAFSVDLLVSRASSVLLDGEDPADLSGSLAEGGVMSDGAWPPSPGLENLFLSDPRLASFVAAASIHNDWATWVELSEQLNLSLGFTKNLGSQFGEWLSSVGYLNERRWSVVTFARFLSEYRPFLSGWASYHLNGG